MSKDLETGNLSSHPHWYPAAMEQLVGVVQELSRARDIAAVMAIVREAARGLTRADGATFVLRDGDQCFYAEENAVSPLWKGCRFPMSACISGWVMLNGRCAVIEDIYSDQRIPADAYRPTFVKSLAMVPIRRNAPLGAIGNYWAKSRLPTEAEVAILQALADTTSVALENVQLYQSQEQQLRVLEERERRIQRQHESLEVFTRALAHDLKEPVRAVQSFARLFAEEKVPAEKKNGYIRYILGAADRMGTLIESVVHYIHLDDASPSTGREAALDEILECVLDELAPLIREQGAVITGGGLPVVRIDPGHMLEVMRRLIENAIRHGGRGVAVEVGAKAQGTKWLVSVRDNGPGISPEYTEKIFYPFMRLTRNPHGSGLGLAFCRRILAKYEEKIWCESTSGGGTAFFFTLPGIEEDKGEDAPQLPRSPESAARKPLAKVLVVDDSEFDLELTRIRLLDSGALQCTLSIAHDATEALALLKKAHAAADPIDLVLLDINMPGADGFELLEMVRQDTQLARTPVVMCTGSTYQKDVRRAELLKVSGYLVKPPDITVLEPILRGIPTLEVHRTGSGCRLLRKAEFSGNGVDNVDVVD